MTRAEVLLFAFGYPAATAVIIRFVPVVRERRLGWLAVHHLGMAAIIAGCASKGTAFGVAVNSTWLVASTAWYAAGGRRTPATGAASAKEAEAGRPA